LYTSVAMTETGELGIARGQLFTVHRKEGDALSPYGMGQPLVEALPSLLAGGFEKRFGPGASQTLFVALEVALVALAAWGAGLAAPVLAVGPVFEGVRCGGALAACGGLGVAHPLLVGLWRLTIGADKALVLYFPLAVRSAIGIARVARRGDANGSALAIGG